MYYWQFCKIFFGAASNYKLRTESKLWSIFLNLEKFGCTKGSSGLENSPRRASEGGNTLPPFPLSISVPVFWEHRTWDRSNQLRVTITMWSLFTFLLIVSWATILFLPYSYKLKQTHFSPSESLHLILTIILTIPPHQHHQNMHIHIHTIRTKLTLFLYFVITIYHNRICIFLNKAANFFC